ncbi:hypothetical protein D5086_017728 [Populus alba]|uniref:Uncharacterized protein n=1 Tax=Populus alba TaxID=43335 RepID=A0ACC4BMS2_POPAL
MPSINFHFQGPFISIWTTEQRGPIDGVEVGVTFEVPLEMHMLSFHKASIYNLSLEKARCLSYSRCRFLVLLMSPGVSCYALRRCFLVPSLPVNEWVSAQELLCEHFTLDLLLAAWESSHKLFTY